MVAFMASMLFTLAFLGSLAVIGLMLYDKRATILLALSGGYIPAGVKSEPVLVRAPRHARRTQRRLAPPPSPVQIRRAAVA